MRKCSTKCDKLIFVSWYFNSLLLVYFPEKNLIFSWHELKQFKNNLMGSFLSEKCKNTIHISPVKHWFVYLHTSQSHRNYINIEHCRCNISFLIKEWNKVAENELQEIFQSLHFILAYSYSFRLIHLQWRFKGQT